MTSSRPELSRPILALAVMGLLAGCSSEDSDWMYMAKAARHLWDTRDAAVTLDEASNIPFATLGVRLDGGREQIMVLATDVAGDRLWSSSGGFSLATRYGRVVRTVGLGTDLGGFSSETPSHENWLVPHTLSWKADFPDLGYYSVAVTCDVRPAGKDPITILGQAFDTVRVDESCRADKLGWSFANSYWVSPSTGRVWRSIVHIHPKGPELELEILRPPLSQG